MGVQIPLRHQTSPHLPAVERLTRLVCRASCPGRPDRRPPLLVVITFRVTFWLTSKWAENRAEVRLLAPGITGRAETAWFGRTVRAVGWRVRRGRRSDGGARR